MNREQFIRNYKYLHVDYEVVDNRVKLIKAPREMQEALEQMPDIKERMVLAWNKKRPERKQTEEQIGQIENKDAEQNNVEPLSTVNEQSQIEAKSSQCSLRNFVKVISLPTRKQLYKSCFTVEDTIEALSEYEPFDGDNESYILTEQLANEYLSLLVKKGYFEMQGNGRTAQYRKICCSYQMDFWKEH
ncbi:MAG: hypothetical protein IJ859_01615 [Synergistaceae bacterium]|nr:hypothetical protein [Synergistaceae bacterium]